MGVSISPDCEKKMVREYVRRLLGTTEQPVGYRPDWLVTTDGSTSVFITYADEESLFYDVSDKDLQEWSKYARAFIVFLMGVHDKSLVVPVEVLRRKLAAAERVPSAKYGDYKLHIVRDQAGLSFREIVDWDLSIFVNNYFPLVDGVSDKV